MSARRTDRLATTIALARRYPPSTLSMGRPAGTHSAAASRHGSARTRARIWRVCPPNYEIRSVSTLACDPVRADESAEALSVAGGYCVSAERSVAVGSVVTKCRAVATALCAEVRERHAIDAIFAKREFARTMQRPRDSERPSRRSAGGSGLVSESVRWRTHAVGRATDAPCSIRSRAPFPANRTGGVGQWPAAERAR